MKECKLVDDKLNEVFLKMDVHLNKYLHPHLLVVEN